MQMPPPFTDTFLPATSSVFISIAGTNSAVSDRLVDHLAHRMFLDQMSRYCTAIAVQVSEDVGCPRRHPWSHLGNWNGIFDYLAPETVSGQINGCQGQTDVGIHDAGKYLSLRLNTHPLANRNRVDCLDGKGLRIDRKAPRVDLTDIFAIGEASNDP